MKTTFESEISTYAPPAESLLHYADESSWLIAVRQHATVVQEANMRLSLSKNLNTLYAHAPYADTDIKDIITGTISNEQASDLYESLADFLEDMANDRLILYLPFEMLPDHTWNPQSTALAHALKRFVHAYMKGWARLLSVSDVRANFIDGDVIEEEMRNASPLTRVVKAAHLIPKLIEKGLISLPYIKQLTEDNRGNILEASIADTLPVLADLGFIEKSTAQDQYENTNVSLPFATAWNVDQLPQLSSMLRSDIERANTMLAQGITSARTHWLMKENERKVIEAYALRMAQMIHTESLALCELKEFLFSQRNIRAALTAIIAARKAVEHNAHTHREKANAIRDACTDFFKNAWDGDNPDICDAITVTLSRWHALGIIDRSLLDTYDIPPPRFDAPFSILRTHINSEIEEALTAVDIIHKDPALSSFLYPALILFGSRVKGYGTTSADLDLAVFVKPNTPIEKRFEVQQSLKRIRGGKYREGKALEFWLQQSSDGMLSVRDFPHTDNALGDSTLTHVLFQGVWCGTDNSVRDLHEKLLTPYLHEHHARSIWLEEMERDILQYRLMHRGYGRFFPEIGGIQTAHSTGIDSESMFWDSGYRRLATKLFVTKVFLPQL